MQVLDSAVRFIHVHGLHFAIMVVMTGLLAVQCEVFQLGGTLGYHQRTEQDQCLANNGKQ